MEWQVTRTMSFDKWWKKEKIENSNYRYYESALTEFQNITLPHNVQARLFANASFECWVTRLPDKARKRGKRGGLRVVFVDAFEELIKELAEEFVAPR